MCPDKNCPVNCSLSTEFEKLKQGWGSYPGALDVWIRNWKHVEQLFVSGKIKYTVFGN
jgi:hypothetical protein